MSDDGMLAYDAARLQTLANKTREAIGYLQGIRSDEPMAAAAMQTVRDIAFRLDATWMPVLARLGADTSMTTWDTDADVAPLTVARGSGTAVIASGFRASPLTNVNVDPEQVQAMLDLIGAVQRGDEAAIAQLNELLEDADPAVVAALLEAMGPAEFLALLAYLAGPTPPYEYDPDARAALAETLASGLPLVEDVDGFRPEEFADSMVAFLRDRRTEASRTPETAVAFAIDHSSGETQAAFVASAVAYEMDSGESLLNTFALAPMANSPLRASESEADYSDPVAVALAELADDPAAAREVLSDPEVHSYLLLEREWNDGYTGILVASAAASAGPDLQDPAHPPSAETVRATNEIASRTVNQLGARGVTSDDVSAEASAAAGTIVGLHAAAVDSTVTATVVAGGRPVVLSPEQVLSGDVAVSNDAALGELDVAVFGSYELGNFVGIASSSDDGLVAMTTGIGVFQQARIDAGVALVQAGDWTDEEFAVLQNQAANLEGFVYQQIGWQAQQDGRDQDAAQAAFIQTLSVLGRGGGYVVTVPTSTSWVMGFYGYGEEVADAVFGSDHEAQAIAQATSDASTASALLNYRFLRSLDAAGVIDIDLAPLPEFLQMTGGDQIEYGGVAVSSGTDTNADGFVFNPLLTHNHFVVMQLDPFNELPEGWDPPTHGG